MKPSNLILLLVGAFISLPAFANSNLLDRIALEKQRFGEVSLVCSDVPTLDTFGESQNAFNFYLKMKSGDSEFTTVSISKFQGRKVPFIELPLSESNLEEGLFIFGDNELTVSLTSPEMFKPKFKASLKIDGQTEAESLRCFVSEVETGE